LDFEKVVEQNTMDKTATLFLTKAKQLEQMGAVKNWTGIGNNCISIFTNETDGVCGTFFQIECSEFS